MNFNKQKRSTLPATGWQLPVGVLLEGHPAFDGVDIIYEN
jgi:hypothetical protein